MANAHLPLKFQDATAFVELDQTTLRNILDVAGEAERLSGELPTGVRLQASLNETPPGKELLSALEVIHELGTEEGRNHVLNAADDQELVIPGLDDLPAKEFIARVWIQSRKLTKLQVVLERARITALEIGQNRTYREFAPKDIANLTALSKEQLKSAISAWYNEKEETPLVDVLPYERDGEWYCEVIKGDPLKRVVEVRDKSLSPLQYRPASSDVIRYDPQTGRIGIATRSPRLLQDYRKLLGNLAGKDEQFFSNENICSLSELQKHGRALFDRTFTGILRIDVVELLWRRGDRDRVLVRGRDCFKVLRDLGAYQLHEGQLVEAKLNIVISGENRPGHVWIRVPNRIEINAGIHEALIEDMLDEVGIRGVFDEQGKQKNFWELYPWRMDGAAFRRQLPDDFDRLVDEKIIRAAQLEHVTHPDHPAAMDALSVVNVDANTTIGVSEDPAIAPRMLTSSDVGGYALDFERLGQQIAKELGLSGTCSEVRDGLWSLGQRALGSAATIAVFCAMREPHDTTLALMKGLSTSAMSVLIAPRCCSPLLTVPHVSCKMPNGRHQDVLGTIVEHLNLQGQVEPPLYLREELIVDERRGQAWFRKIPLSALKPGTHAFKFLSMLAATPGSVVSKQKLNETLSPARTDDTVARKAKAALLADAKDSFSSPDTGLFADLDKRIVSAGGGYALRASARVLA
jgi:hypothetical protein